jgi:hypothetical protein
MIDEKKENMITTETPWTFLNSLNCTFTGGIMDYLQVIYPPLLPTKYYTSSSDYWSSTAPCFKAKEG